ncbi:MAG: hypothetical protein AAGJ28_02590 [Pseudomonadota bacterium]
MRFADRFPRQLSALQADYIRSGHAYHNWDHVTALLGHFERLYGRFEDPLAVETALYYHDVIYVPGAKDNERRSAARLRAEMNGHLDAVTLDRAEAIVLATETHTLPETGDPALSRDCALFLDMDLAILGARRDRFDAYNTGIREEYQSVPDELFYPARQNVMRSFLEREKLFVTDEFQASHDARARENLRRLVGDLP